MYISFIRSYLPMVSCHLIEVGILFSICFIKYFVCDRLISDCNLLLLNLL